MCRRVSIVLAVALTATLNACSHAPTSTLTRQGTGSSAPPATATPMLEASATPAPAASATPHATASPTSTATGPTPTPGPISLSPSSVAAANVIPAPGSDRQPTVCSSATTTNYTCFSGDPTEIDPTEAGYSGAFTPNASDSAIAVTTTCSASGAPTCSAANGILVYPQGVGSTTISVTDGNGNAATEPVAVSETTVAITLQNLPSAQQLCIGYTTAMGANGNVVSYAAIVNASSNPTVTFANAPLPVNVNYTMFKVVVNPANSGMSGCLNGIAQVTSSNFSFAAGVTNTKNVTVTATSQ